MTQQCPLPRPCPSTTYHHRSFWGAFALLVPHGHEHQAQREIERERGIGRQLNYWHGELALKRAHASLRNYPLCIETAPPPSAHTHNGLTNTTKNGKWTLTDLACHTDVGLTFMLRCVPASPVLLNLYCARDRSLMSTSPLMFYRLPQRVSSGTENRQHLAVDQ